MSEIDDAKKEAWRTEQSVLDKKDSQIYQLRKLITKLCDALETANPGWPDHYRSLVQHAREAANGR